jgi:hypothetical protein
VAVAALVAGCTAKPAPAPTPTTNGMDALEASAILDASEQALLAAKSFHVSGSGDDNGDKVQVDLVFAGNDKKGTMTIGDATFEVLVAGGTEYFKGDSKLWSNFITDETTLQTVLPLVQGKWVSLPAGQSFDLEIKDILKPEGTLSKGDIKDVDGQKVIALKDSANDGELDVALTGKPYPLQIVSKDGTLKFTDIDKDVTIAKPDPADVFDLSKFAG